MDNESAKLAGFFITYVVGGLVLGGDRRARVAVTGPGAC
jgi:hypothetical protein